MFLCYTISSDQFELPSPSRSYTKDFSWLCYIVIQQQILRWYTVPLLSLTCRFLRIRLRRQWWWWWSCFLLPSHCMLIINFLDSLLMTFCYQLSCCMRDFLGLHQNGSWRGNEFEFRKPQLSHSRPPPPTTAQPSPLPSPLSQPDHLHRLVEGFLPNLASSSRHQPPKTCCPHSSSSLNRDPPNRVSSSPTTTLP